MKKIIFFSFLFGSFIAQAQVPEWVKRDGKSSELNDAEYYNVYDQIDLSNKEDRQNAKKSLLQKVFAKTPFDHLVLSVRGWLTPVR